LSNHKKLATIDKLEDTEQVIPKQGGNRYVCQTCGSTRVAKRTVTSLKCLEPECGHETIIEDTGWKEQNGHNVQKQHAFGDTNIVEEGPAASFDTQKQNAEHSNLNTPPALRSDLEIEQDAGQLLLDIAGENASHIEMIPREQKYTTVPYALNQDDMIAHLRGKRTKGAKLYYADGTLRGMMFDGDNHQDWQHLKDAAKLLQAVGFNPILEPSPTPIDSKHEGGGHLVIVFAERVDAYSAFQTVYQYTGDLLQSVEQWPSLSGGGNNVRLPGGKYIKPGFQAWCNLYNADGLVLSHDGTGAAHALLQYQTPIDLVNQYERPVVEPPVKLAPKPQTSMGGYLGKDVAPSVIADFNDTTSWDELAARTGGYNRQGYFPASWRGDRNPNVKVNPKTDLAKDFSRNAWLDCPMDKYQVYCLIEGGSDWQAFRKRDLAQRCRGYREQAIAS
jgi:hypothetical protein